MFDDSAAYDFSLFEDYSEKKEEKKDVEPIKKREIPVSLKERRATSLARVYILKVMAAVMSVFCIFSCVIYLNVKLDETATQIAYVDSEIEKAKSENTRLYSSLAAIASVKNVSEYAENKLGMVKVDSYRIHYLESDDKGGVVLSGGRSYDNDSIGDYIRNIFK